MSDKNACIIAKFSLYLEFSQSGKGVLETANQNK